MSGGYVIYEDMIYELVDKAVSSCVASSDTQHMTSLVPNIH